VVAAVLLVTMILTIERRVQVVRVVVVLVV
jgi:hypothetical protein